MHGGEAVKGGRLQTIDSKYEVHGEAVEQWSIADDREQIHAQSEEVHGASLQEHFHVQRSRGRLQTIESRRMCTSGAVERGRLQKRL